MSATETVLLHYRLDASRSRFTVQVFAGGLLSVFGHNPVIAVRGFGGDVKFVPGTLESASLLMLVRADSLAVASDVSRKDRQEIESKMLREVLEVARYPEIVYMSTRATPRRINERQYQIRINGQLSLHGVARELPINANVSVGDGGLRARGQFTLRQSDYNIKPVSVAAGTLKVKNELKLSFDIIAGKQ